MTRQSMEILAPAVADSVNLSSRHEELFATRFFLQKGCTTGSKFLREAPVRWVCFSYVI